MMKVVVKQHEVIDYLKEALLQRGIKISDSYKLLITNEGENIGCDIEFDDVILVPITVKEIVSAPVTVPSNPPTSKPKFKSVNQIEGMSGAEMAEYVRAQNQAIVNQAPPTEYGDDELPELD